VDAPSDYETELGICCDCFGLFAVVVISITVVIVIDVLWLWLISHVIKYVGMVYDDFIESFI